MRVLLVGLLVAAVKAEVKTKIELTCDGAGRVEPGFRVHFDGEGIDFFPKPTSLPKPRMTLRITSHAQRTWRRTEDLIKDFMWKSERKERFKGPRLHAYAIKDGNKRIQGTEAAEWLTFFTDPQKIPSDCRTKTFWYEGTPIPRIETDYPPDQKLAVLHRTEIVETVDALDGMDDEELIAFLKAFAAEDCAVIVRELYGQPRRERIAEHLMLFSPFSVERGRVDDLSVIVKALETAKATLPKFKRRYHAKRTAPVPKERTTTSHRTTSSRRPLSQSVTTVQNKPTERSQKVMDRSSDESRDWNRRPKSNSQSGTAVPRTGSKIDNSAAVDCVGPFAEHCVELSNLETSEEKFAYLAGLQDRAIAEALSLQLRIESEAENRRSSRLIEQSRF